MLTGSPPFDAPTATAIALKHIQQPPPSLKEFRQDIPLELEQLLMQLLAKDPSARPQSAAALCEQLKPFKYAKPSQNSDEFSKSDSSSNPRVTDANPSGPAPRIRAPQRRVQGETTLPSQENQTKRRANRAEHTPSPPEQQNILHRGVCERSARRL